MRSYINRHVRSYADIHISTHGQNTAAAAAFHRLYLWPTAEADGRLHAYELLDLDLHGLELLSMSACETALGRFDLLDNIRGLPAAFLLRGTGALVGTLWPAEVEAAKFFFTTMYKHLASGEPNKVKAFSAAQMATRVQFSQYRDWGPFYMIAAE